MLKRFLIKQALKLKGGMSGKQADQIAEMLEKNPELLQAMKKIEDNPELKKLFEMIQKEVEEHVKKGGNEAILSQVIMQKYQHKLAKYGPELMPLFQIMQKLQQ